MAYYRRVGDVPPKRHTQHRRPDGGLYAEELMGEEGFSADSALLYHRGLPSALVDARPWELPDQALTTNSPLVPRHLKLHDLFPAEEHKAVDAVTGRRLVLGTADVRISYAVSSLPSPYYRNAVGDECVFVERGTATVETVFGALEVGPGDYVVLPRATTHRWVPTGDEPLLVEGSDVEVFVKHRGDGPGGLTGTVHVVPEHPFDVVGWDGCLYPYVFNVADFEPITGRVHQPPPVHQVFEGTNFVICNFVPRKVDYHPLAVPVPYYHSNVDSDEVMFYVDGDYEARKGSGIGKGSISLHPGGHSHGPQPGAVALPLGHAARRPDRRPGPGPRRSDRAARTPAENAGPVPRRRPRRLARPARA